MRKVFPGSCDICIMCGEAFNNDYARKEHTSLKHPWETLADVVKQEINCKDVVAIKIDYNDKISDDDMSNGVAGEENNLLENEPDSISNQLQPNETKVAQDVVSKMIEIQTEKPKGLDGANYYCKKCDLIFKTKPGQKNIPYLIKSHICSKHFRRNFENGLNKHFNEMKCNMCGKKVGSYGALKKHLISTHQYFDDLISKDFNSVLANATEPNAGHGLKRKWVQIHDSELLQKLKVPKTDSSLGLVEGRSLNEDDDICHIQSRIEFSDSHSEDET